MSDRERSLNREAGRQQERPGRIRKTSQMELDPSSSRLWTMAASQNLPAVLNDPAKGKQKDFFTRSWGDTFVDTRPIPPSPYVCELPQNAFEKYIRKLRRHSHIHSVQATAPVEASARATSPLTLSPSSRLESLREGEVTNNNWHKAESTVSRVFMDPNFDLTKPETFAAIFQIDAQKNFAAQERRNKKLARKPGVAASKDISAIANVESKGRLIQERLSHQLDQVEVSIAHQVAQKSHHFFQVMTYHDALMTQLSELVKIVRSLRANLKSVDSDSIKPSLEICQLKRRLSNSNRLLEKLKLLSSLHQAQPTIQMLLASSEFSGALDLITTSCEVMAVDLHGVVSLRHVTQQLQEVKTVIGKVLLEDFQTFIGSEIGRETLHIKATAIEENRNWGTFDTYQLKSVIFGLLRQNSYSFLEALEDASGGAIKSTMRDVLLNIHPLPPEKEMTMTNLVMEFAKEASSEEWLDLFDTLIGTLIALLHRIAVITNAIREAILEIHEEKKQEDESSNPSGHSNPTNGNNTAINVSKQQLDTLLTTNREVIINICEQMTERVAKLLTQRSKPGASDKITVQELTNLAFLVSVFSRETAEKSSRQCSGLHLSLQSQTVMFVQNFHEERRSELSLVLEKELWKKDASDFTKVYAKLIAIPNLKTLFLHEQDQDYSLVSNGNVEEEEEAKGSTSATLGSGTNGDVSSTSSRSATPTPPTAHLGTFKLKDESFSVVGSIPEFLKMLAEYCNLCSMLPNASVELGLKTAEFIKFLNSRVCQLILGAGAISVAGLKTITIRNLALALRSLQLVVRIIPFVLLHFKECYQDKAATYLLMSNGSASPQAPKAESKQFEILQRHFDQAVQHLKNHTEELYQKILSVVEAILQQQISAWQPPQQLPSSSFKALCKQLTKLHESTSDIWLPIQTHELFTQVHKAMLKIVGIEIKTRGLKWEEGGPKASQSRALLSEMAFYGQSMMRLKVLDPKELEIRRFERLWD